MGRLTMGTLAMVLAATSVACWQGPGRPDDGPGGDGPGRGDGHGRGGDGLVAEREWRARQDDYLRFATTELRRSSPLDVLSHVERDRRDRRFRFDASTIAPADFAEQFDRIDRFRDTSDFDLMYLMMLWYGAADELSPELRTAIEDRMVGFRYWYTDPRPAGVIDENWYWSENHRIIFHTVEHLAGQALPDARFGIDGATGAEHRDRAADRIDAWLAEKARWGFSEWHSDVYLQKDVEALALLVEHTDDRGLARRASMVLDLVLYDLALHQLDGNLGATHGRSYMKDKSRAADQDVFNTVKLLFDTTDQPYTPASEGPAVLAASHRYRLPEVILRVARSGRTFVDREQAGVPLDVLEPYTPTPVSQVPGVAYDDPDAIPFWWERGGFTAWQLVPLTLATIDRHDLWDTETFRPYRPLVDLAGGDPLVAQQLAHQLACMINVVLLAEVETVTHRSRDAMLSTAQDYRPGCLGQQHHAWQATLDEEAVVFTTLPGNEPRDTTSGWQDGDLYWSGSGSIPRSAQQGRAAVHMYAPRYPSPAGPPLDAFAYLPYTHAYFPTERFDEVRQQGNWTFGRRGDGYVALWSWRPTHWRSHDPARVFTNGLTEPFDLVADGGADNVWVVEVGDAERWRSFDAFVAAVGAARVDVTDRGEVGGVSQGFDVAYASPSEGTLELGWTGPFTVDGEDVPLRHGLRYDNPFGRTAVGDTTVSIRDGRSRLTLDFAAWTRTARG